jgi:hypothetical protein
MPSIRIGFASDFTLNNSLVGFGTTTADQKLEVAGTLKGDFQITGVTTLTEYSGFVAQQQHINEPSTIGFSTSGIGSFQQYYETETGYIDLGGVHHGDDQKFNTLSEDLVIDDGQILNITNTEMVGVTTIGEYDPHTHESYVCAGSLEQVSVTDHFSVPNGGTNDRQLTPIEGTVRFNTDLNTLEFFNGNEWRQFTYNQGQSGRGVLMGGRNEPGAEIANISYIQITTKGNATNFGDLNAGARETGGCLGSETRSIKGGGQNAEEQNEIEYITTASQGNAIDFGDLNNRVRSMGAVSSSTRGLFASGCVHPNTDTDVIDYIEIATVGNALDFGDHVANRNVVAIGSPIKACFGNGNSSTAMRTVNFASKGDTVFFGDATQDTSGAGTIGNSTRGIFCGGYLVPLGHGCPAIGSITFASLGNTTDFGEMLTGVTANNGGMSTPTKGVIGPGQETFSGSNTHFPWLDEITISTYGSAVDFGDPGPHSNFTPKVSDSHGGLGGF